MARPTQNYSEEMRQRAVRMVFEVQGDYETQFAAIKAVAQKLGTGTAETLRRWVRKAEIDRGERPRVTSAERRQKKFTRLFGARKMWLHLRGALGVDVARCTVERLMREQGWIGALRRKNARTTVPDEAAARAADRVDRRFWAPAPNRLWCADFTYVKTADGTTYTAFIFDVFSRRIIGWMADTQMSTTLVLDAIEMAVWARRKEGVTDLAGLVHHNDYAEENVKPRRSAVTA